MLPQLTDPLECEGHREEIAVLRAEIVQLRELIENRTRQGWMDYLRQRVEEERSARMEQCD